MFNQQRIDLAIHALLYMAYNHDPSNVVMVKEMAAGQNISESYLAKIFQSLAKTDLLISLRGKYGGYKLGKAPTNITVGDVVRALDSDQAVFECNAHERECPVLSSGCMLTSLFDEARKKMFEVLDRVTLENLSEQIHAFPQAIDWIGKDRVRAAEGTAHHWEV